jgi:hypothetical protein
MERAPQAPRLHPEFIGMADYAPTSVHDLLEGESCGSSFESSPCKERHPSWQCNMVHTTVVDQTGGAINMPANPPVERTPKELAAYEQERLKRAKACTVDEEHKRAKRAWAANARSTSTPRTASAHAKTRATESKILRDEYGTP